MEMIGALRPTSKMALKQQCILIARGDIKDAMELYHFLIDDMGELPDTDPVPPSWFDNLEGTLDRIFGWVDQTKDTLSQGAEIVRGIAAKRRGAIPSAPTEEALPDIN